MTCLIRQIRQIRQVFRQIRQVNLKQFVTGSLNHLISFSLITSLLSLRGISQQEQLTTSVLPEPTEEELIKEMKSWSEQLTLNLSDLPEGTKQIEITLKSKRN